MKRHVETGWSIVWLTIVGIIVLNVAWGFISGVIQVLAVGLGVILALWVIARVIGKKLGKKPFTGS